MVNVAIQEVIKAMSASAWSEGVYFVDLHTGHILFIDTTLIASPSLEANIGEVQPLDSQLLLVEQDHERYVAIPQFTNEERLGWMHAFADSLSDEHQKESVAKSIHGWWAIMHFHFAIKRLGLNEAWKSFEAEQMEKAAREFVAQISE